MRNMAQSCHASIIQLKYIVSHFIFWVPISRPFYLMPELEPIHEYHCDINYPNIISVIQIY